MFRLGVALSQLVIYLSGVARKPRQKRPAVTIWFNLCSLFLANQEYSYIHLFHVSTLFLTDKTDEDGLNIKDGKMFEKWDDLSFSEINNIVLLQSMLGGYAAKTKYGTLQFLLNVFLTTGNNFLPDLG